MRLIPTCDDAQSPTLKAAVHAGTVLMHVVILVYHVRCALRHWSHRA